MTKNTDLATREFRQTGVDFPDISARLAAMHDAEASVIETAREAGLTITTIPTEWAPVYGALQRVEQARNMLLIQRGAMEAMAADADAAVAALRVAEAEFMAGRTA